MKTCSKCGVAKPLVEFYRNSGSADGHRNDCKACILKSRSLRYANDAEMRQRIRDRADRVREASTMKGRNCRECGAAMVNRSRSGAAGVCTACKHRLGYKVRVPRELRIAIYERDGWICQICDRPVDPSLHPNHTFAPTLDHIAPRSLTLFPDDSPENLRLTHRGCNSARGNRVAA